uniref:DUF262 domain-containing protein n=1 Tax=uncultured Dysgonomonas sp. TaxID=206096 RepID=UPI002613FFE7|nr:DUF262 domain-containing protein [uncultured Dysgonomonas sp.]
MQGDAKQLLRFMDGADKRFIIPVYQRNYDWKLDNCRQLYDDLIRVIRQNRRSHFFGSLVSSLCEEASSGDYLIIDGQQRLTTVSLFLLAIVKLLENGEIESTDTVLKDRIKETYLIDKYQPQERKVRLKPVKHDSNAFEKLLFGEEEDYIESSNVTQNYRYFYNRIKDKQELTAAELFEAVKRLEVIDIFLHPGDNAQLIFESLNSTGLGLEEGDKIRNFILMGLDPIKQEQYYENYWNKIEVNTDYNTTAFVRDYLTFKQGKIPSLKVIYQVFKEYVNDGEDNVESILKDLLIYSQIYQKIIHATTQNKGIDEVLVRLNLLDMGVTYPFLLALFKYKVDTNLTDSDTKNVLECIESFIFRRFVCGIPTNALNKIFSTLHKDVFRLKKENDHYVEVLKYVLLSKTGSGSFPADEEFSEMLSTKNMYRISSKYKQYLFDRFENEDNVERVNIVSMMENGDLTVEHIMPQTLTPQWKNDLGSDFSPIHDTWLHTLANLTLTGYNPKYSNKSFLEKRNMEKGFIDSGLRINRYIANCDKWTLYELEARNESLALQALKLWKYPQSVFAPPIRETEEYSLADDFIFTGYSIKEYTLLDGVYQADTWVEMLVDVVKKIYELYPAEITKIAEEPDTVDIAIQGGDGYVWIANRVYLYTATSTMSKIRTLTKIFEECGIDKDYLSFKVFLWTTVPDRE